MIEADVGDDAVQPGVETAFETESMEVFVNFQEGFLINVAGIFVALHQVERQTEHIAIVTVDEFLEGIDAGGL